MNNNITNTSATSAQAEIAKKLRTIAKLIESGTISLSRKDDITLNLNMHGQPGKFFGAVRACATFLQGDAANASSYRTSDCWGNTALVKTNGLHVSFRNLQRE